MTVNYRGPVLNKSKILKLALRIVFSLIIVAILLFTGDIRDTVETLSKTDHRIWLIGIILYLGSQFLSAYKWKLLAEANGFKNKFKDYLDFYYIGMFFSLFLPTTVGGDVAKCFYLTRSDNRRRKAPAAYSILADRYTGVLVIIWMATLTMFLPVGHVIPLWIKLLMVLFSLSVIVVTPIFPAIWMKYFKRKNWVRTMLRDIRVYWDKPALIATALAWSFVFHLMVILIHVLIGTAIGLNIPTLYYFVVYPMSAIAGFVPFTFNGVGPREAMYVLFLGLVGVNQSQAVAFGALWFVIVFCASLVGGIFYIKGKHTPPPEEFELEDAVDEDDSLADEE